MTYPGSYHCLPAYYSGILFSCYTSVLFAYQMFYSMVAYMKYLYPRGFEKNPFTPESIM